MKEPSMLDSRFPPALVHDQLLSNTRPPSSFDQVSLFSDASQQQRTKPPASTKRSSAFSAHNIWNTDQTPEPTIDSRPVAMSPGQYFKARSLPFNSMHNIWHQHPVSPDLQGSIESHSESNASTGLVETYFKSLPATLHRPGQWVMPPKPVGNLQEQEPRDNAAEDELSDIVQSLRVDDNHPDYSVHPRDELTIRCQVRPRSVYTHGNFITVTNAIASAQEIAYRLYSSRGLVSLDDQQGTVQPGATKDIFVRPKPRALEQWLSQHPDALGQGPLDYQHETIAMWIDGQQLFEFKVFLDWVATDPDDSDVEEQDANPQYQCRPAPPPPPRSPALPDAESCEDCAFCTLEKRYPSLFADLAQE